MIAINPAQVDVCLPRSDCRGPQKIANTTTMAAAITGLVISLRTRRTLPPRVGVVPRAAGSTFLGPATEVAEGRVVEGHTACADEPVHDQDAERLVDAQRDVPLGGTDVVRRSIGLRRRDRVSSPSCSPRTALSS